MDDTGANGRDFLALTATIVSAYVSRNAVPVSEVPAVITSVDAALRGLTAQPAAAPERPEPAVPIRRSVQPEYLISLEDGKPYKSLKRHLSGRGMTPEQYRAKWGLPKDYPMVAPNYAKQRSELARSMRFGHKRTDATPLDNEPRPDIEADSAHSPPEETAA